MLVYLEYKSSKNYPVKFFFFHLFFNVKIFLVIFDDIANILNLPAVVNTLIWGNFRHLTGNVDRLILNLGTIFKMKYLLVF